MSQRYIGGLIYNPPGGFSGFFDGSGDYLTLSSNASMDFGTGAFTIECWVQSSVFSVSASASRTIIGNSGNSYTMQLYIETGAGKVVFGNTGSTNLQGTSTVADGNWHHVVVSRSGTGANQTALFVDGVRQAVGTNSQNYTSGTIYIGAFDTANGFWNGYISNLRIVKGAAVYDPTQTTLTVPVGQLQAITSTALLTCAYSTFRDGSTNAYTVTTNGNTAVSTQNPFPQTQLPNPALGNAGNGVYSMSQYQALRSQNLWPAIDPYFDYVTLMLHGNGTNGAQNNTFLDSSTNNFTITRNGNTTQGTFTPYGANWSNYFDGSGDYLSIPSSAGLRFDGQFCVEGWVNFNAFNTQNFLISQFTAAGEAGWIVRYTGTALRLYAQNGAVTIDRTWSPSRGVWYHFAITRDSSNDIRFFIDGTQLGATATGVSTTMSSTNTAYIGGHPDIANDTNAYLSNIRVVKGSAVYTANFTPSTAPLTAITNTSLLTCADNRFIDDSSNNFTITRNGDVSVQRFSPFAPTTPYAAGTIGGSGYFDGNGDTLSTSGGNVSGTGAFTVEFWMYPSLNSTQQLIYGDATNGSLYIYFFSDNLLYVSNFNVANQFTSIAVARNAWTHVVIVRNSGGTYSVFLNGSRVATLSGNTTNYASMPTVRVGGQSASNFFLGYLSDVRVSTNSALYDPTQTTITVPTAPVTAITNTNLLLNFTNGGIIDNAMMNDLETVGNAQISTSVSKFGGGSIYLDGTDDRLTAINRENFNFGTGDFTVEFWINASASGSFTQVVGTLVTGTEAGTWRIGNRFNSTNAVYFARGNGSGYDEFNVAVNVNDGAWHHVAVTRASGTVRIFVDGTQVASSSITGTCSSSNPLTIGYNQRDNTYVTGYIDDLRITKGYARYTTSFTPQRSQWQDQ